MHTMQLCVYFSMLAPCSSRSLTRWRKAPEESSIIIASQLCFRDRLTNRRRPTTREELNSFIPDISVAPLQIQMSSILCVNESQVCPRQLLMPKKVWVFNIALNLVIISYSFKLL